MQTAVNLQISFQNVYPLIREVHTVNTHANYVTIQKFYIIHVPVCFVLAIPQEASNMHFSALSSATSTAQVSLKKHEGCLNQLWIRQLQCA